MMKVTESYSAAGDRKVIICDFSPPKSGEPVVVEPAKSLDADFICVAYNPGRAVRANSALLALAIQQQAGKEVIFNLATRDMNKLALQSLLLGAKLLGLQNVVVLKGDEFTEKDLTQVRAVDDFSPSGLIRAIASMNQGLDFRGRKLQAGTDFCIGATIDLGRGVEQEALLTRRKASSGVHFFLTQPVFNTDEIASFEEAYRAISGGDLAQPVFYGLQVLAKDGVIFSSVPERIRADRGRGREGTDIALELLHEFQQYGVRGIYLIPPILKGGRRDYQSAQRVIEIAKQD